VIDEGVSGNVELERDALAAADRVVGESRRTWMLKLIGRNAGRALGALFLAAGVLKALAPLEFAKEISGYGIVTDPIATGIMGFVLIVVECGLGAALLSNLRPRLMLALTLGLLAVFLVAIGTAWWTGAATECGCFGPWKRSMPVAFTQDLMMMAVAGWALWSHAGIRSAVNALKLGIVGTALAAGVTIPAIAVMSSVASPGSLGAVGSTAFRTMEVSEAPQSLATGEHLVLLMSTDCDHCKAAVPAVNALFEDERLPKVTAVAMGDRVDRGLFRQDLGAKYPIAQISKQSVVGLVDKAFPRLFLVRDGVIVAIWDGEIPSAEVILAKRQENGPA